VQMSLPVRAWAVVLAAVGSIFLLPTADAARVTSAEMVQVGTYEALIRPDFTAVARLDQVLTDETMGIGTFTNLDGELIMLGGVVYQVRTDGVPRIVDRRVTTPFLQAVRFRAERNIELAPGTACADLLPVINQAIGDDSGVVAVRVRGTFSTLVTRSVAANPPPFRPLAETIAAQTIFPNEMTQAALVGFRQGDDARGLGQPGLHLHSLAQNRSGGGHVLSCVAGPDVQVSLQRVRTVRVTVPD
jgi:acetolactate decarboxylase